MVLTTATSLWRTILIVALGLILPLSSSSQELPFPFLEEVVISGLDQPTVVRFADDGTIFVGQKDGLVLVFDHLDDADSEVVIDLTTEVNSYRDRGLLGLAIHPEFPAVASIFVLYTYDAPPGSTAPVWNDQCPDPPHGDVDGCVVSARLSRVDLNAYQSPVEQVLIQDGWCQQFPSHSIGTVAFGGDGALYVGAGDGANFRPSNGEHGGADFGQLGGSLRGTPTVANPCGDPPVPPGGHQILPSAEGGALRSQDLLSPNDPVSFSGSILRVDPETGAALPDNPLFGGPMVEDDRVIAFGLRNPFRFFVDPQTDEIWIGDVGWNGWDEIDRIVDPTDSLVENFGWPCYEGNARQPDYDVLDLTLCEALYDAPGSVEAPYFAYRRDAVPDPDRCGTGGNAAISGIAVYPGGDYPSEYEGGLFFADFANSCIWAMLAGPGGVPDPATIVTLVAGSGRPVHLEIGPQGDLFYVDLSAGEVRRVRAQPGALFGDGFESGDTSAWSAEVQDAAKQNT
ncbi:MAG: PQQ-dependent sugar dehydrogenase [Thermoanaerobaculia bacterium]|nr:PQQ-dependent sugar dehydrogenase [Thermoanaerobaculia bacterium]